MSRSSKLGAALFDFENSWGEDLATYTYRAPALDMIDASGLERSKIDGARAVQYRNERALPITGVSGGTFKVRLWLTGIGSSTAGAMPSDTILLQLLANAIGSSTAAATSGDTLTAGASVTSWTTTGASGFTSGAVAFLGALGDGDGNGQAFVVNTHGTNTLTSLVAVDGSPVNGAVVYSAKNIYPVEVASSASVASTRWQLLTANQQYECHGCFPVGIEYTTEIGQPPAVTITYQVSWWEETSTTFPTATSTDDFVPAPIAAGSFFFQAFGTTTRNKISVRSFSINHTLGVQPLLGPGGIDGSQVVVGAVRTADDVTVEWVEDAEASTASPTRAGQWDAETYRHCLITFNGAATGKKVAFYARKGYLTGRRPVQTDNSGVNAIRCTLQVCANPAGSTDLLKAAYVWALA